MTGTPNRIKTICGTYRIRIITFSQACQGCN